LKLEGELRRFVLRRYAMSRVGVNPASACQCPGVRDGQRRDLRDDTITSQSRVLSSVFILAHGSGM